jgi:fumarate hydratase subunit beta
MRYKKIFLPKEIDELKSLKVGEWLLLNGPIFSARDQACKLLVDLIKEGKGIPLELKNSLIYHMGPSPTPPGRVSGSAGPTTSKRMDPFVSWLLSQGIVGFIGKGKRDKETEMYFKKYKGVYLVTVGGAGAYLGDKIKKMEIFAFPELGPEAIYYLEVEDFPAMVAIDSEGNSFWK